MPNYFKEESAGRAASRKSARQAAPQADKRRKTPPDDASQRPACVPGVSRVYLASPFRADTPDDRDRHRLYLFDACEDATDRGESWIAPHALYTAHLDERDPTQRDQGLRMGLAWIAPGVVDAVVVYADLGISEGMAAEMARAEAAGIPVMTRSLPGWTSAVSPYDDPFKADPFKADPVPGPADSFPW